MKKNVLFVISGPSGVGKGTLVKLLLQEDETLSLSVSCTTRAPRAGERDGVDYFFLSREAFLEKARQNGFLEYDEHFEHFYGTPKSFVDEKLKTGSVILEIDVVGALKVRETCAKAGLLAPVLIMVVPPDLKTLEARLDGRRTESEEERRERLRRVEYELGKQDEYDYVVVNDELTAAKRRLQEIIEKNRNSGDNI